MRRAVMAVLAVVLALAAGTAAARPPPTHPEKTKQEAASAKKEAKPAGPSFEQIMRDVLAEQRAQAKVQEQREERFREALAEQRKNLKEQLAARAAAEALGNRLSKQFDDDQAHIKDLHSLLKDAEGNLGELFGVTRQVAGDSAGILDRSLISAQFAGKKGDADRVNFMLDMAGAKALPSIDQLDRIWYELMREMVETGKVVNFKAKILEPDDKTTREADVVRIGPFIAVSDGKYLKYLRKSESLQVLARQPSSQMATLARRLQAATGKKRYVRAVVDPARGALLEQYVERPTFLERIEKGRLVGFIIIGVGILGLIAALIQYIYLFVTRFLVKRQLKNRDQPSASNPLGRLLLSVKGSGDEEKLRNHPELVELRVSEAVLREVPKLERFQSFLRLAVAAGPLLGLIGTVIGMIITFQSITAAGASDPRLLANGIGQAMVNTVLGLAIAIPLLFVNGGLAALSHSVVHILDEQSSNLLAEFQTEIAKYF